MKQLIMSIVFALVGILGMIMHVTKLHNFQIFIVSLFLFVVAIIHFRAWRAEKCTKIY